MASEPGDLRIHMGVSFIETLLNQKPGVQKLGYLGATAELDFREEGTHTKRVVRRRYKNEESYRPYAL